MTSVERQLRKLYLKAWSWGEDGGGPLRNEKPKLTGKEKAQYIGLVHRLRLEKRWYSSPIRICPTGLAVREEDTCESCCATDTVVVLVQPGIISKHEFGDWICVNCDPRAQTLVEMEKLREVIGAEST